MLRASYHPDHPPESRRYSDHPEGKTATSTDMDSLVSPRPARTRRAGHWLDRQIRADKSSLIHPSIFTPSHRRPPTRAFSSHPHPHAW